VKEIVSGLRKKAEELYLEAEDEKRRQVIDQTIPFLKELKKMIFNGEIIHINVNGTVRSGKSTMIIKLGQIVIGLVNEYNKTNKKFGIRNIARDQQEYSQKLRDHMLSNTVIVVDEWNALEEGGENSTIEKQLLINVNDVQAVRYIHTISASPTNEMNSNSEIYLEVIPLDKTGGTIRPVRSLLYYNLYRGGQRYKILLGYVDINVEELIRNWLKIKKRFYKSNEEDYTEEEIRKMKKENGKFFENLMKTEEDIKIIESGRKKDFYIEYMIRKSQKIDLLNKEGIFRSRDLEYAVLRKRVIEKLRRLMKLGSLTRDIIGSYIMTEASRLKIPFTILGNEREISKTSSILSLWGSYFRTLSSLNGIKTRLLKTVNPLVKEALLEKKEFQERALKDLQEGIEMQEEELDRLCKLKAKYDKIESEDE